MKSLRLKLKQRWLPYLYGYLGKLLLWSLGSTCRFQVEGLETFLESVKKHKCILMFWHNRLAMVPEILMRHALELNYAAMISKSRDGEVIAVLANSYKNGHVIRVPHDARSEALETMIQHIKEKDSVMIITPDGPRGPKYEVKPGVIVAAKKTSAAIIPLSWEANRYWALSTWDGLMLPKPFSTIRVTFGDSIFLDPEQPFEEAKALLENKLLAMSK